MSHNYDEDILIYAFRYALGRMTYAVSTVANEIKRRAADLSPKAKALIVKEITEAESDNRLGMKMDAEYWREVRALLDVESGQPRKGV
jgi:hypothetical protein